MRSALVRRADRLLGVALKGAALIAGSLALLVFGFLVVESGPGLAAIGVGRFLRDPSWHPAAVATSGQFGLVPMVAGTLLAALGAILVAAPLGVLSAIFSREVAPPFVGRLYRRVVEILAGVPSVVYGLWGLVTLVPLIARWRPPGASLAAAIAVLALMTLPTVALLADAAIAKVPSSYRQGAAALGLSRSRTIVGVVLPAARCGIATGVLLAGARALGETMAVLMVAGNVVRLPSTLFDPVRTLTANIALEMSYALGDHRAALFISGLVLLLLVTVIVAAASGVRALG